LIAPLAPLLRRHHVPVYINGHDHSMQYVEMDGTAYITTGAGSETYETGPANRPGFAAGAHGFLRAALRPEALEIAFVTESGAIPFTSTIPRQAL
jgi:acid phosphatase